MSFTVDKQLLEILACPAPDHAPLVNGTRNDPSAEILRCTECGRQYPIRDGIPVLLLDESDQPQPSTAQEDPAESTNEQRPDGA